MEDISEALISLEASIVQLDELLKQRDQGQLMSVAKIIKDQVDGIVNFDQQPKAIKAKLTFFKGKALAVTEKYDKSAEELLTRSIRLEPRNFEAWSTLGEVFYAKKDYVQARRCFEGSLEHSGPKKDTLRKLSIVFRFLDEPENKKECVAKSIELAKQALSMDYNDGESWYILGNAHLTSFFTNTTSYGDIEKALKSYSQSQKLCESPNPDLHFNKSMALGAAEMYNEALSELDFANQLDESLCAKGKQSEILSNLENIHQMILKKCNIKKRTINGLCKSIPCQLKKVENFQIASVADLQIGKNPKKMLSLKVLGYSKLEFPPIFVGCDFKGDFFAISIYSFPKQTKLALGCSIFINDPFLAEVSVGSIQYKSVQVRDPNNMMIQGN